MRALVLDQNSSPFGGFRLRLQSDYPTPEPPAGESLVRVRLAGICGTDLEQIRGYMGYHGVPGHEFVGEVVRTQSPELSGKRVVGEINAACGRCELCRAGLGRHCPNRTVLGILGRDGAFADYLCLPDQNLIAVPDDLPDELAVFTEPAAAAFEIFEQTTIEPAARVAVLGDGRLGAMVAMVMATQGLRPVIGGHHADKLARLAQMGLAVQGEDKLSPGYDVVVDCTGSARGLARSLELVKPRGRLVLKTTVARYDQVDLAPIVINEITVLGSRCGRFAPALAALSSGRLDPRPLLSAVMPLADAQAAFSRAADPSTFKVVLNAA